MGNISKVLLNLILYSGILYLGIIILSKKFDLGTKKFMNLNNKNRKFAGLGFF